WLRVEAGNRLQRRIVRELPRGIFVETKIKGQRERDPYHAPEAGFAERDGVGLAMKHAEIQGQQEEHEARESSVEPPVVGQWKICHFCNSGPISPDTSRSAMPDARRPGLRWANVDL